MVVVMAVRLGSSLETSLVGTKVRLLAQLMADSME